MRFFLVLAAAVAVSTASVAQKIIPIGPADKQVNNIPRKGLKATIELDEKFVEKLWEKKLKEQGGKFRSSKGTLTVDNAKIKGISESPVQVISLVEGGKNGTEVWYAVDLGSSYITAEGDKNAFAAAEKFLKDFAVYAYREDVSLQIADAERVLQRTQTEHERTVKEAADIQNKIAKNKEARRQLEKQLEDNANALLQLEKDVVTNEKAQKTSQEQVEEMRKALEVVKAKASAITVE